MREAHARNPQLRHSAAGQKKKCGHCGEEGHNRKTCPQLLSAAAASAAAAAGRGGAAQQAGSKRSSNRSRVILIQEVDADSPLLPPPAAAAQAVAAAPAAAVVAGGEGAISSAAAAASTSLAQPAADDAPAAAAATRPAAAGTAASSSLEPVRPAAAGVAPPLPARDLVPTLQLVPGMALSPDGDWVLPLPRTKEECVAQAAQVGLAGRLLAVCVFVLAAHSQLILPADPATVINAPPPLQAVLRAWDDGLRRQSLELLLPQARPTEDGGWPGGIRQQFRWGVKRGGAATSRHS